MSAALAQTTKMSQEESRLLNLRELSTGKLISL